MRLAQVGQVPHKKKNELEWCQGVGRKALITCCSEFSSAQPSDFPAQRGRGRPWLQRWCCSCALPHRARWTRDVHLSRLSWNTNQTSALWWGLMASHSGFSLPALKNSVFYFLQAASSFSFQLFMEGRILSSFSSTGALHLLGNPYPLHPLARGYSVWQVKNPRLAPGGRAMIQCLEVWKLYLNFVTQQDTQRKITLLKSIVIHENTLSASSKIAVWQFLSCKAAPMQDTAINPVSDEWTSKWKHPCLHGTVKHWQATAEADHQDAPLHQPWRNIYSEDKNWKLQ